MDGRTTRQRLSEFASSRAITLASITPLSQVQLDFAPRAGRWSVGEVADHLLLAEDLYRGEVEILIEMSRAGERPYRKHTFAEINVSPLGLPTSVLSYIEGPLTIMGRFLPDSVRRIVTEIPILPTRNPDFATPRRRQADELKRDLAASIARTTALVEANTDLDLESMVTEHPLTGAANVTQVLTFLARHERRHQGQMEAIRSDRRFPRA